MTKLTFYGGVGEIGGNKILLESSKARMNKRKFYIVIE